MVKYSFILSEIIFQVLWILCYGLPHSAPASSPIYNTSRAYSSWRK